MIATAIAETAAATTTATSSSFSFSFSWPVIGAVVAGAALVVALVRHCKKKAA